MHESDLQSHYEWFHQYASRFSPDNPLARTNLDLKIEHTMRVAENCRYIAESLNLPPEQRLLAETLGVFHDVGRLLQFSRYGTFLDSASKNHAVLSIEALDDEDMWRFFPQHERSILSSAIMGHNVFALPEDCTGDSLLFTRIIRDADRLDGLYMVASGLSQRYTISLNPKGDGDAASLPDTGEVSPLVMDAILQGRCVRYADVKTKSDKALVYVGLIYDMNFPCALERVRAHGYIDGILDLLPGSSPVAEIRELAYAYIDDRLTGEIGLAVADS